MLANTPLSAHNPNATTKVVALMVFIFMLILAAVPGIHAVRGVQWGADIDFFRDEAFVRTLLEGHYGADPIYRGEHLWYTPLIFTIEAGLCKLSGLPPEVLLVRAGAWLILLAPISFFGMVWYFRGPVTAVFATAVYLFFAAGQQQGWAVATYTPWLFPVCFIQAFFYLDLVLIHRAFRTQRWWPSILAGFAAGITFLGHAAPGIIAVLLIVLMTAWDIRRSWREGDRKSAQARYFSSFMAALSFIIASLPLLWYIVGCYSLHMVNRAPFLFTYYALTLREFPLFLFHNINWVNLAGLGGLVIALAELWRARGKTAGILVLWFFIALALFLYGYAVSVLDMYYGIRLPGTTPTVHYYFYMKAALSVFTGVLIVRIIGWIAPTITWLARIRSTDGSSIIPAGAMILLVIPIVLCFPSYVHRKDLFLQRANCIRYGEDTARTAAFAWLRQDMTWNDVVLSNADLSCFPVMASGRHMVVSVNTMPNPYVDHVGRVRDRDCMFAALSGKPEGDPALFGKYEVTHLLVTTGEDSLMVDRSRWFPHELHRNGSYVLYSR